MKRITGFKLRNDIKNSVTEELPPPYSDAEARDRVMEKIRSMGEDFFEMSEREYSDWLNALPRNEFIELIALNCENKEAA